MCLVPVGVVAFVLLVRMSGRERATLRHVLSLFPVLRPDRRSLAQAATWCSSSVSWASCSIFVQGTFGTLFFCIVQNVSSLSCTVSDNSASSGGGGGCSLFLPSTWFWGKLGLTSTCRHCVCGELGWMRHTSRCKHLLYVGETCILAVGRNFAGTFPIHSCEESKP